MPALLMPALLMPALLMPALLMPALLMPALLMPALWRPRTDGRAPALAALLDASRRAGRRAGMIF
jgi:hypothetical protein